MTRCETFNQPAAKVMKLLALLLRGVLAAGAATMIVAYLLLTNSHL